MHAHRFYRQEISFVHLMKLATVPVMDEVAESDIFDQPWKYTGYKKDSWFLASAMTFLSSVVSALSTWEYSYCYKMRSRPLNLKWRSWMITTVNRFLLGSTMAPFGRRSRIERSTAYWMWKMYLRNTVTLSILNVILKLLTYSRWVYRQSLSHPFTGLRLD